MSRLLDWMMTQSGCFEVLMRRCYYRLAPLQKMGRRLNQPNSRPQVHNPGLFDKLTAHVTSLGIENGDILIVHSSMDALEPTDATPETIITFLQSLVGDEGTLVFPAFPTINKRKVAGSTPMYDPARALSWTGVLPNVFCKQEGVLRSLFPYNSLAARGARAADMMAENLKGDLPHGSHSAWEYCMKHDAKILFLGTPSYHSNTMLHVAEELLDEEWPIRNWFEVQNYLVRIGDKIDEITIRTRRMFWSRFIAEQNTSKMLQRQNLLAETAIDGLIVGFVPSSSRLVSFLIERVKKGKIIYRIPKKYWKR